MHDTSSGARTDDLIDGLSSSLAPVGRRTPLREIAILAGVAALQLAGSLALLGGTASAVFQADPWGIGLKAALLFAMTVGFAALAFRSFEPAAPRQRGLALAAGGFLLGFAALTLDWRFSGSATATLMPQYGMTCFVSSVSFSLPVFITLSVFMRGAASVRPGLSALFVGLAAGGWGVFIYGLQCPFTSIAYVGVWYGTAVGLVTLVARLALPRIARW